MAVGSTQKECVAKIDGPETGSLRCLHITTRTWHTPSYAAAGGHHEEPAAAAAWQFSLLVGGTRPHQCWNWVIRFQTPR